MSAGNSSDKRIIVWVQQFKDRDTLMLQWNDPDTGKRKSKSAGTTIKGVAEMKRTELEYELNHGLHQEASRMSWEKFRELFEAECVSGKRKNTRGCFVATLDLFERLCSPQTIRGINERAISSFVAKMRTEPGRRKGEESMMPSTIKVRLQFLHTALSWAAEQKFLPEVPKFPRVKVPKKDPQPVAPELFERMLAKAKDQQMRVYLLCGWLACGCPRRSCSSGRRRRRPPTWTSPAIGSSCRQSTSRRTETSGFPSTPS
jgi:hypothetical protein